MQYFFFIIGLGIITGCHRATLVILAVTIYLQYLQLDVKRSWEAYALQDSHAMI